MYESIRQLGVNKSFTMGLKIKVANNFLLKAPGPGAYEVN
jgi:hypothetical protein